MYSKKICYMQFILKYLRNLSNFRCDYSTKDKGSLDYHIKAGLKSEEIQKCNNCDYKSCTPYGLANHIKLSHPELKKPKKAQYDCERYVFCLLLGFFDKVALG